MVEEKLVSIPKSSMNRQWQRIDNKYTWKKMYQHTLFCLTNNLLLNNFIEKECLVLPTGKNKLCVLMCRSITF